MRNNTRPASGSTGLHLKRILAFLLTIKLAAGHQPDATTMGPKQTIKPHLDSLVATNHLILVPPSTSRMLKQTIDYTVPRSGSDSFKFIQPARDEPHSEGHHFYLHQQIPLTRLNGLNSTTSSRTPEVEQEVIGLTEAAEASSLTKTDPKVFKETLKQAQSYMQTPAGAKQKLVRLETTGGHVHSSPGAPTTIRIRQRRQLLSAGTQEVLAVQALLGQRLVVPCNHTAAGTSQARGLQRPSVNHQGRTKMRPASGAPNGQGISLLVWYKGNQLDTPIFVADARAATSLREAKQQTSADWLRGRAHLEESTRLDSRGLGATPALVIEEATIDDVGLYTCTVDFHKAPTQTHQVNVSLIDPPREMFIRDELAQIRVESGLVGPYDEDTRLALSCELEAAGQPVAQISWWRLESVSSLADARLPMAAEQAQLVASDETSNYLSTLVRQGDQSRDYFVAFLSSLISFRSGAQASRQLHQLTLPFEDGRQLRHWSRVKFEESGEARNRLRLSLGRSSLGDQYMCLAQNSHLMAPLNLSIQINLNLRPLEVKIVNKSNYTFLLGQKLSIECQVHGSKPSAQVRWFRGEQPSLAPKDELKPGESVSETNRDIDNHLTKVSYLIIVPQLSDNQKSLTCSGSNPRMPHISPLSDSLTMNVQYPARLELKFGSNFKPDTISTDQDVFMDCNVQANPPIHDLSWLFNGKPLMHNVETGVILSNHSLVIRGIRIEHRGYYQCVAQNALGTSTSNKLELKPRFAPVCDHKRTKSRYEVPVGQQVRIDCHVQADPNDIEFSWKLNKTLGDSHQTHVLENIPHYETNFTHSHVNYELRSRRHQAQLLCWASNGMGVQAQPCVILVVPTEAPDPVISCFFDDFSSTSFSVHCQAPAMSTGSSSPASSLNQRQTYLLEIYPTNTSLNASAKRDPGRKGSEDGEEIEEGDEISSGYSDSNTVSTDEHQVRRLTSENPSFHVADLRPNTNYQVLVYAQNSRGRSAPISYQRSTLPGASAKLDSLASTQLQTTSGQVQLINKRPGQVENMSLASRLVSLLNVTNYINSDEELSIKPAMSIALIVLLCVVSIVTVSFFTSRLCRLARGQPGPTRKQRLKQLQANGDPRKAGKTDLRTYDKRDPQLVRLSRSDGGTLTPARSSTDSKQQPHGGAGIGTGSDTSRDTNTESTLVISSRTGTELNSSPIQVGTGSGTIGRSGRKTPVGDHKRTISVVRFSVDGSNQQDLKQANECEMSSNQISSYCLAERLSSPAGMESANYEDSHTPQVSIQSGSDYTTSHNESELQMMSRQEHNLSEPIYVIGSSGGYIATDPFHLLNPIPHNSHSASDHPTSASLSAATGATLSKTAIANNNLLAGCSDSESPNMAAVSHQLSFLPPSLSIPTSLSESNHGQLGRRFSQEILSATDLSLGHASFGSYLTLRPDGLQTGVNHQGHAEFEPSCCAHTYSGLPGWSIGIPAPFHQFPDTTCNHSRSIEPAQVNQYGTWSDKRTRPQASLAPLHSNTMSRCCSGEPSDASSISSNKPFHRANLEERGAKKEARSRAGNNCDRGG